MQITTTLHSQIARPAAVSTSVVPSKQEDAESADVWYESYTPSRKNAGIQFSKSDIVPTLVIGGIGLAGAAVGALAGANAGVISGLVGSVLGASAGASLGIVTPGERIGLGAIGGAVAGTLIGAMGGNTASAIALGLAGATIPVGFISMFAIGR